MTRRLDQPFRCEPLRELSRQLLFAPPGRRAAQARRAEALHDQIDPDRTYPLEFIAFRLTGYRPERNRSLLLVGEAVRPDLRLMIDQLSRSAPQPVAPAEAVETPEQLASRLHVSTKTITRWRKLGLRWRWCTLKPGRRPQIVIPAAGFEHFQARHGERVERAGQFTQIEPAVRRAILDRARRIAEARDASLNQVAAHLAQRTGRALETIRLILEKHDRQHPGDPIFVNRTGPLTPRQRRVIVRAHRIGVRVARLARRFKRTRATVYRVIKQQRAADAQRVPLSFVASPMFERDDADAVILRRDASAPITGRPVRGAFGDLPAPLHPLFAGPPLLPAQQRSLFIRYNYLKFKAHRRRAAFDPYEPRGRDLDAFDEHLRDAGRLREQLVRASMPLVLSVARRHLIDQPGDGGHRLFDLLEQGQAVLFQAVEQFNATRSSTFESHLTNRLLQRFAAVSPAGARARRRRNPEALLAALLASARAAGVSMAMPPAAEDDEALAPTSAAR